MATSDLIWNQFVQQHPSAHFLQLREWGYFKERFGWKSSCVSILNGADSTVAGALVLYKPVIDRSWLRKIPGLTVAYIPKGPLVEWRDSQVVRELLGKVEEDCRKHNAGILKIEPNLADTRENRALLAGYGFRPSPHTVQPQSTILLDIQDDEAAILARMKSKWRYNIRLAARKEVTVREGSLDDLPAFTELMQTTGARNHFAVHEPAYYRLAYELFVPQHAAFLYAEYKNRPLAAMTVFAVGESAWYPWGASGNLERNRMPNYALHWEAIRWAKERGATQYDLWGIPDPIGELAMSGSAAATRGTPAAELPIDLQKLPGSDLWGVYRLKQGFGGNVIRYVGAWDRPVQSLAYRFYSVGLTMRAKRLARGTKNSAVPMLASGEQSA